MAVISQERLNHSYASLMIEANIIEAVHENRRGEVALLLIVVHLSKLADQPINEIFY